MRALPWLKKKCEVCFFSEGDVDVFQVELLSALEISDDLFALHRDLVDLARPLVPPPPPLDPCIDLPNEVLCHHRL